MPWLRNTGGCDVRAAGAGGTVPPAVQQQVPRVVQAAPQSLPGELPQLPPRPRPARRPGHRPRLLPSPLRRHLPLLTAMHKGANQRVSPGDKWPQMTDEARECGWEPASRPPPGTTAC